MSKMQRREALRLLGLGTAALGSGYAVCVRPLVEAVEPATKAFVADTLKSLDVDSIVGSEFEAASEILARRAELDVMPTKKGTILHYARLKELRAEHGTVVAEMERSDGHGFKVQICLRDNGFGAPQPVARTKSYDLFLANSGRGNKRTHEEEGLAIYALAGRIAVYEKSNSVMNLDTKRQWWTRDHGRVPA